MEYQKKKLIQTDTTNTQKHTTKSKHIVHTYTPQTRQKKKKRKILGDTSEWRAINVISNPNRIPLKH